MKTTYKKYFKLKLKVIKLESVTSIKKAKTIYISLKQNKWDVTLSKTKTKENYEIENSLFTV